MADRFNEKFPELHAYVGGVTGVDISRKEVIRVRSSETFDGW